MSKDKDLEIIEEEEIGEVGLPSKIEHTQITMPQMMEMAQMLSKSTIVPQEYRNRPENVFLALDTANRLGMSPLAIMNGMYVVQGRPSFSGSFIAGLLKSTPLFSDVELIWVGEEGKESWGCYVQAMETRTGKLLKGASVTLETARLEGWTRNPKWKSMSELMLSYRAYSFFGRVHASELLSGIYDRDELEDIKLLKQQRVKNPYDKK